MMTVVEITKFGTIEGLEVRERDRAHCGPDELLVAVKAVSLHPGDCSLRRGAVGGSLPLVPGHDLAGRVADVGSEVSGFKEGDEVWCYLGDRLMRGSYAEFVAVPAYLVSKKPFNLNFLEAAAAPMPGLTAYEAVSRVGVGPGQSVLVTGASDAAGAFTAQLCRHRGAGPVLVTAGSERTRRYYHEQLGFPREHIISTDHRSLDQLQEEVLAANQGQPIDIAFDLVGHRKRQLCLRVLAVGGAMVSVVDEPAPFIEVHEAVLSKSATLHFQYLGARARHGEKAERYGQELRELKELFESRVLQPPRICDLGRFSEAAIRGGHQILEEGKLTGELVVRF